MPRRTGPSVSLFPFLAVLVCAMGALIFLLIVTTQRVRDETVAQTGQRPVEEAQRAPQPSSGPRRPSVPLRRNLDLPERPRSELDDPEQWLRTTRSILEKQRDGKHGELAELADQLEAAEKRKRQLASELRSAEAERRQLQRTGREHREDEKSLQQESARLEGLIAELETEIERVRRRNARKESKYAIIPFDGQSGTTRRPIFVECTDDGLRFLPEGVTLAADDLQGFTPGFNPLLAGAQTLVDYWYEKTRHDSEGSGSKPYVLLLVRPSGSVAYYVARKLLQKLEQPFGYELIGEDRPLDLPDPDPNARARLRDAVEDVLAQRQEVRNFVQTGRDGNGRGIRFRPGVGFEVAESAQRGLSGRDADGTGSARGAFSGTGRPAGPLPGRDRERGPRTRPGAAGDGRAPGTFSGKLPDRRTGNAESPSGPRESDARPSDGSGPNPNAAPPGQSARRSSRRGPSFGSAPETSRSSGAGKGQSAESSQRSGRPSSQTRRGPAASRPSRRQKNARSARRRSWGLSDPWADIGYERTVKVRVESGQIVIGEDRTVRIREEESPQDLLDRVVRKLEKHAESWGEPPDDFYWVPRLRFVVRPGGYRHVEQLWPPLRNMGLSVTVDLQLEGTEHDGEGNPK